MRMSIFATLTYEDLNAALMILINTGVEHGIYGVKKVSLDEKVPFEEPSSALEESYKFIDEDMMELVDTLAGQYPLPKHIGSDVEVASSEVWFETYIVLIH